MLNGGASSWYWNFGDGTTLTGNDPNVHMNPFHTYAQSGTYTVNHIVTTQAGCSDTVSHTLVVNPPPVVDFSLTNGCVFDSIQFNNLTQASF